MRHLVFLVLFVPIPPPKAEIHPTPRSVPVRRAQIQRQQQAEPGYSWYVCPACNGAGMNAVHRPTCHGCDGRGGWMAPDDPWYLISGW